LTPSTPEPPEVENPLVLSLSKGERPAGDLKHVLSQAEGVAPTAERDGLPVPWFSGLALACLSCPK